MIKMLMRRMISKETKQSQMRSKVTTSPLLMASLLFLLPNTSLK